MKKLIIAGDIGGTKTLLRLLEVDSKHSRNLYSQRFASNDYPDFTTLLAAFIQACQSSVKGQLIAAMCLGIAGPVKERTAKVTNLPWLINADELQQAFAIARVELMNDFMAVGYGLAALQDSELYCLQEAAAIPRATRVVIGAGTGLGQACLVWENGQYKPYPSEGSHVDFAPRNHIQYELLKNLQSRFGHVSYERVVSGSGLVNIFEFLTSTQRTTAELEHALQSSVDKAATITAFAVEKKDHLAKQALDIFIDVYGAQAGNFALTCLAQGGVYIAGGIAPKLIQRMAQGDFMHAFRDKGRFASLMESLPVHVVMNAEVGLEGAVQVALRCMPV
jgi:glucokinase